MIINMKIAFPKKGRLFLSYFYLSLQGGAFMENNYNNLTIEKDKTIGGEKSVKIQFLKRDEVDSIIFKPHCHLRLELLRVVFIFTDCTIPATLTI